MKHKYHFYIPIAICGFLFPLCQSCSSSDQSKGYDQQTVYFGKNQNYIDVYRDIWNASTPSTMNVGKAVQFESPHYRYNIKTNGVTEFSGVFGEHGFTFRPIFFEGTIHDARSFEPVFSIVFKLDFSTSLCAPNDYYVGKTVNALLGFGVARYANQSSFSQECFSNVDYLMLECNGHFVAGFKESFVDSPALTCAVNNQTPYRRDFFESYDGLDSFFASAFSETRHYAEDDSFIIGLDYVTPENFSYRLCHKDGALTFEVPLNYGYFRVPKSKKVTVGDYVSHLGNIILKADNPIQYYPESFVHIECPNKLIEPYLTEFTYKKQGKRNKSSHQYYLYKNNKTGSLLSIQDSDATHYSALAFSEQYNSGIYGPTYSAIIECGAKKYPTIGFPEEFTIKCLQFGEGWWPLSLKRYGTAQDFVGVNIENPHIYFNNSRLRERYILENK